ncbi:hypothetical protein HYH03_016560 [Edaphochlamys debaryana]|uniref:Uncharacterized protein n=1 Tax=Edaphochlamys debaryana TaxID=47281 RepID=A0A835XKW8_9CHLO|nr:hypothetical protein HYH03_016560 [Edaphochlamys debaryana]|eukprot:KAG2484673.1 hypothetical protein HYH03_016560 [Edaphochlamys debaryana]
MAVAALSLVTEALHERSRRSVSSMRLELANDASAQLRTNVCRRLLRDAGFHLPRRIYSAWARSAEVRAEPLRSM